MSDFEKDRNQFPEATVAHWKVLLREINSMRTGEVSDAQLALGFSGRKLAAIKKDEFIGLRIKNDKSIVALGAYCDLLLI